MEPELPLFHRSGSSQKGRLRLHNTVGGSSLLPPHHISCFAVFLSSCLPSPFLPSPFLSVSFVLYLSFPSLSPLYFYRSSPPPLAPLLLSFRFLTPSILLTLLPISLSFAPTPLHYFRFLPPSPSSCSLFLSLPPPFLFAFFPPPSF